MAGLGYKQFVDGVVAPASEANGYFMEQTVMRFASTAARDTALSGVLNDGLHAFTTDTNTLWVRRGGAWRTLSKPPAAYTPTWKDGVGGTSLSIGNGTLTGRYAITNDWCDFEIRMTRGSTTNLGTTGWAFGFPVTMANIRIVGPALVFDQSATVWIPHTWFGVPGGSELVVIASNGTNGRRIDNNGFGTTPTAWATSDEVLITGRGEVA
jgi:hypothetical protein